MAKRSIKWVCFLLVVAVAATAIGVNGYDRDDRGGGGAGKVFPPKEDYGGDRGGYGRSGGDRGRGRGYDYGGDRGDEGGSGKVFPPKEERGSGGRGGRFPPEEERGGGGGGRGGRFPPEEERGGGGSGGGEGGYGGGGRRGWTEKRRFILSDSRRVVATEAGGMRVVRGVGLKSTESPMHIGFITMEPNSMFIPQYLDSSLILFIQEGEARIGSIYNDNLVEKDLNAGDLYRIQAGSAFYLVNIARGQRLHVVTSIDTTGSIDFSPYESFSIGGGTNPRSVLTGFATQTLATAFNVSQDAIMELLSSRKEGQIVFLDPESESTQEPHEPSMWKRFLEQEPHARKTQMKRVANVRRELDTDDEMSSWSLSKLLVRLFGYEDNADKSLDAYNIYNQKAGFKNDYGWSVQVTGDDYDPLKFSDFGVYLVNLSAGSMMAPHVNPTATEYGVVLSGTGNIQVVYPNGSLAMDAEVNEGDVFWIPRYFPFCQVSSRSSPFVFFGFSTSARNNRPQFLVGQGSVLQTMMGPGVAAAFGLSEDRMADILNAQSQTTILPSVSASPGGGGGEIPQGEGQGDSARGGEGQGDSTRGGEGQGDSARGGEGEGEGEGAVLMKNRFVYNVAMGME